LPLKKSPYGKEDYDSTLERGYMVELERDPAVKSWTKKHGIKIPYKFLLSSLLKKSLTLPLFSVNCDILDGFSTT